MITKYFKYKTKTKDFIERTEQIIKELEGKRVLICGDAESFIELNKIYHFDKHFNIAAFADFSKIEKSLRALKIKKIKPKEIEYEDFEAILITGEQSDSIINYIMSNIDEDRINAKILFEEKWRDAASNLDFLLRHKFKEYLPELIKKMEGKKVIFYGGGLFFQLINDYYDLSPIKAIGIADKKLSEYGKDDNICGYKLYSPEQIVELNPDYVIVTTRRVVSVFKDLYYDYLKNTNIKIIPLVKRSLMSLIREG